MGLTEDVKTMRNFVIIWARLFYNFYVQLESYTCIFERFDTEYNSVKLLVKVVFFLPLDVKPGIRI